MVRNLLTNLGESHVVILTFFDESSFWLIPLIRFNKVKVAWVLGCPEKDRVESSEGEAVEDMEGMSLNPLVSGDTDGTVSNGVIGVDSDPIWTPLRDNGSLKVAEGVPWSAITGSLSTEISSSRAAFNCDERYRFRWDDLIGRLQNLLVNWWPDTCLILNDLTEVTDDNRKIDMKTVIASGGLRPSRHRAQSAISNNWTEGNDGKPQDDVKVSKCRWVAQRCIDDWYDPIRSRSRFDWNSKKDIGCRKIVFFHRKYKTFSLWESFLGSSWMNMRLNVLSIQALSSWLV